MQPQNPPTGLTIWFWRGRRVGFLAGTLLKKVPLVGGSPVALSDRGGVLSASWGEDGSIFTSGINSLYRVPADGGTPQRLTLGVSALAGLYPQLLPCGKAVLFTASQWLTDEGTASVQVQSLETGRATTLVREGSSSRYVPSRGPTGYLVYLRRGTLYAAALNPAESRLRGPEVPVVEDVEAPFDVSPDGALYYRGRSATSSEVYPVLWLDHSGTRPLLTKPGTYFVPRLSPDGQRLALHETSDGRTNLLVYELERDRLVRMTTSRPVIGFPVWAPDGQHLVFSAQPSSANGSVVEWISADGGQERSLVETKGRAWPFSFAPDGARLSRIGGGQGL